MPRSSSIAYRMRPPPETSAPRPDQSTSKIPQAVLALVACGVFNAEIAVHPHRRLRHRLTAAPIPGGIARPLVTLARA